MATEIERKFLLANDSWREGARGQRYRQGYLSLEKERVVRVRTVEDTGYLTIKGAIHGISRPEFEYPIPVDDAEIMLESLCYAPIIDKTRYRIRHGAHVFEVDEFHGANAGLVVAEVELGSEDEAFDRPEWLGEEVTEDWRYANANLIKHPYSAW